MALVNNVSAFSAYAAANLSPKGAAAGKANRAGIQPEKDTMVLDIEAYKEALNESLEILAGSLTDLDQGVQRIESMTIKLEKQGKALLSRQKEDPFRQMYHELFMRLNKYSDDVLAQAHKEVSAERALSLLKV